MDNKISKDYISKIAKASTYFVFRNGPIKKLYDEKKLNDEEIKEIQIYMQNHLAYLFNILLEENNINKFNLIISTMDKFYINDNENVKLADEGFDILYDKLFNESLESISIKK